MYNSRENEREYDNNYDYDNIVAFTRIFSRARTFLSVSKKIYI